MRTLCTVIALVMFLAIEVPADGADYGYPIPGSFAATIMGTPDMLRIEKPADISLKELLLEMYPERKKPDIFYYDDGLVCNFAYQKKKAPLAFLNAQG